MAETDRVKSKDLRKGVGFSIGVAQSNYNAFSLASMPGGEAISISVSGTNAYINTPIIFGSDVIRYASSSTHYSGGGLKATSIGSATSAPSSLSGSTIATPGNYITFPSQGLLLDQFTSMGPIYKSGGTYTSGNQKLMSLRVPETVLSQALLYLYTQRWYHHLTLAMCLVWV